MTVKSARTIRLSFLLVLALLLKIFYEPAVLWVNTPFVDREGPSLTETYSFVPRPKEPDQGLSRDLWSGQESDWRETESKLAADYIQQFRSNLAILPIQGDKNAFDPIERSLMTRLLYDRVERSKGEQLPDPSAVQRFLGIHRAEYADNKIRQFAGGLGSDRILELRAQHNRDGSWVLKASLLGTNLVPESERTWTDLTYTDEQPPSVAFSTVLEEVLEFAGESSVRRDIRRVEFDSAMFEFPNSIRELVDGTESSPLHAAAYLQLLAALHPRQHFNESRTLLFERSLIKLQDVSPDSPYYRYFKARAFAHLGRRPAAIEALGQPDNEHGRALLHYLNADLPALRNALTSQRTSALDYMAWLDLYELSWLYGETQDFGVIENLAKSKPVWSAFIRASIVKYDTWARYSLADINLSLDKLMPAAGISYTDRAARFFATNVVPDELMLTRLLWEHVDSVRSDMQKDTVSAEVAAYNRVTRDMFDLVREYGAASHVNAVRLELETRGLAESALSMIARFDLLFAGHPAVTMLKSDAYIKLSDKSSGEEKKKLVSAMADAALDSYDWTRDVNTRVADIALIYKDYVMRSSNNALKTALWQRETNGASRRTYEWPRGAVWKPVGWQHLTMADEVDRCLAYGIAAFGCLDLKIHNARRNADDRDAVRDQILAEFSHRFIGSPKRRRFEVAEQRSAGNSSAEQDILQRQIDAGVTDWNIYKMLGRVHFRDGRYKEAADVWLSSPDFAPGSGTERVVIGNQANITGSMLYWVGQHELATPLLELAANQRTGALAPMAAAQRLAQIEGDIEGAANWAAGRVRRYGSKFGIRDLMQLLHILDESGMAWGIFDDAQSGKQNSQMWSGALIGHRKQSASIQEIADWVHASQPRLKAVLDNERGPDIDLAARYLLLAGTMDRGPEPKLAELVAKTHTRKAPRYYARDDVPEKSWPPYTAVAAMPDVYESDYLVPNPTNVQRHPDQSLVENRYTVLAKAMSAFNGADYKTAYDEFNEAAYLYKLDEYLPYLAFSAAMLDSDLVNHLIPALNGRETYFAAIKRNETASDRWNGYRFDEDLTHAILAAFNNNHGRAIELLKKALNNRPYIDDRTIYPMYQVVDLADRLYEHTKVDAYRELALDLSRRHTVILPMYAWAYFVVAKYSSDEAERVTATASGLVLDPLSYRGALLPKELKEEAEGLLESKGAPYLQRSSSAPSGAT